MLIDFCVGAVILAIALTCIWRGWILIGPDGFMLPAAQRPGIVQFYVSLICHPNDTLSGRAFWTKDQLAQGARRRMLYQNGAR
jgi:hypothetical protein